MIHSNIDFVAYCPECETDVKFFDGWQDGNWYGGQCYKCKKEIEAKSKW